MSLIAKSYLQLVPACINKTSSHSTLVHSYTTQEYQGLVQKISLRDTWCLFGKLHDFTAF